MKDKLEIIGINWKFLDIFHTLYKATNASLLYKNKVTELFYTTIGLKQDDIFCTMFFYLFINNLLSLLADNSHGTDTSNETLKLGEANIISLLFAEN